MLVQERNIRVKNAFLVLRSYGPDGHCKSKSRRPHCFWVRTTAALSMALSYSSTAMLKVALNAGSSQDGIKRRSEAGSKLVAMVRRLPAGVA